MAEHQEPSTRLRTRWSAVLIGAAPHLALLSRPWWPGAESFGFLAATSLAAVPFIVFGKWELAIVPATLMITLLAALHPRTRRISLWLLVGTLSGATLVLVVLSHAAVTWT